MIYTFNPSPVDSGSSPSWLYTDGGAVFGVANGLQSLTLLYDTSDMSSQSTAATKCWAVLVLSAFFSLEKKDKVDNWE